jgi:hypothetical protein
MRVLAAGSEVGQLAVVILAQLKKEIDADFIFSEARHETFEKNFSCKTLASSCEIRFTFRLRINILDGEAARARGICAFVRAGRKH